MTRPESRESGRLPFWPNRPSCEGDPKPADRYQPQTEDLSLNPGRAPPNDPAQSSPRLAKWSCRSVECHDCLELQRELPVPRDSPFRPLLPPNPEQETRDPGSRFL